MFTGLVEEVGILVSVEPMQESARLAIRAPRVCAGLARGDSVSVSGACLTAVAIEADRFFVDCVAETLRRTTLGALARGDRVNLERALRLGDRLGGHLVQGHVDGTGGIADIARDGEQATVEIEAEPRLLRYVIEKGSVAVDGVSLTVAARTPAGFRIALIPHTLGETTLGTVARGARVNLEVDMVAKYLESLVAPYRPRGEAG